MLRLRSRDLTAKSIQVIGGHYFRSTLTGERASPAPYSELTGPCWRELTMDEKHPGPPYETGGPFFRVRHDSADAVAGSCHIRGGQTASGSGLNAIHREIGRSSKPGELWKRAYEGGVIVRPPVRFSVPSVEGPTDYKPGINDNNLQDLGSRAYQRLRPKPDKVDLFQSLVEIREIPTMIRPLARDHASDWERLRRDFRGLDDLSAEWRKKSRQNIWDRLGPKPIADQFVGTQFGWIPFVGIVNDLIDTTINYDRYLDDLITRNGSWQQREFSEDELESSTEMYSTSSQGLSVSSYSSPSLGATYLARSSIKVYRETVTRIWYEGSFRFYYPEFNKIPPSLLTSMVQLKRVLRLYGLYVSPSLIYRVTPWTWLVDWFAGIGNNISALEDLVTERVVSRYIYLMRHTYDRYKYVLTWTTNDGQQLSFETYDSVDCKRRLGSESNFGFSTAPSGLTAMQQAILAALGISRVS